MPIEFKCQCGRTLRVPDDAAGKQAKCPSCEKVVSVPPRSAPDAGPFGPTANSETADPFANLGSGAEKPAPPASDNPYASPAEPLGAPAPTEFPPGRISNQPIDPGTVFNYAWDVWKNNLGLLVGVALVLMVCNGAFQVLANVTQHVFISQGEQEMAIVAALVIGVLSFAVQTFLTIGQAQICLRLARGQRAEFSQLFDGGPVFLSTVLISIMLGVIVGLGFLLCIIPGIICILVWWPTYYLVVDGKTGALDSFGVAQEITANNKATAVILFLICFLAAICGILAFCVGILFATPLTWMIFVVAYLMMSGQIPRHARYAGPA